jgi:hypothetical protein
MSRLVADDLKNISVYKLKKWGLFTKYKGTTGNNCYVGSMIWSINNQPAGNITYKISYLDGEPIYIELDYKMVDTEEKRFYKIFFKSTNCNYGNKRWWFTCATSMDGGLTVCRRRVAKLYLYNTYFCCRHCLNLTYEVNNEKKTYRYLNAIFGSDYSRRLEDRLQKTGRCYYAGKPTKTYQKLIRATSKNNTKARRLEAINKLLRY